MATMKDVARLAGVSHGTVSNVVNGAKNVSVDKIRKVEAAMKKLGYTPNTAARNLKMDETWQLDLVVPNLITGEFISLYESLRRYAFAEGYTINLKVTDGIASRETQILKQSLMDHVDGVILVTCQPEHIELFHDLRDQGLKILFCMSDPNDSSYPYVGLDMSEILEEMLFSYHQEGKRVALVTGDGDSSYHDHLISTYVRLASRARNVGGRYAEVIQVSPEFAARGAASLFQLDPIPDVAIASNEKIALEIHRLEQLLTGNASGLIDVVTLNQTDNTLFFQDRVVPFPYKKIARASLDLMLDMIKSKEREAAKKVLISPDLQEAETASAPKTKSGKKPKLRILLNNSPASEAVQSLLAHFTRTTGIEAEITTRSIAQVYDAVIQDREKQQYDLYSVDIPWLQELVDRGQLSCLDPFFENNKETMSIYPEEVLTRFSKTDGHFFAVPFSFSAQLLFYRSDLFDEIKNQRLYFEKYGEEMRVPENWEELNKVARLFTREYNPDSETKYGMTMGGSAFSGASCEFLPRLWTMGGSVFDERRFLPDKKIFEAAMDNYLQAFRYANPKAVNWWWDEQVNEFVNGRAAMMMTFTEHANALSEKNHSRIAGKYQVAVLPGQTSVLGGWSLAIREGTPLLTEAQEFLNWISLRNLMKPSAILGRVYPVTDDATLETLDDIYGWFDTAVDSFRHARARTTPAFSGHDSATAVRIERILGQCIHRAILEKMNGAQAVHLMDQQFHLL